MDVRPYRRGVVLVLQNNEGKLLVGKRPGLDSWQLPQGGIDGQETPQQALYREAQEEVGCNQFVIVKACDKPIRYDFPEELEAPIAQEFCGQEQYWYLCQPNEGFKEDLEKADDKEFVELAWLSASEALHSVVHWKQDAYKEAFAKLQLAE